MPNSCSMLAPILITKIMQTQGLLFAAHAVGMTLRERYVVVDGHGSMLLGSRAVASMGCVYMHGMLLQVWVLNGLELSASELGAHPLAPALSIHLLRCAEYRWVFGLENQGLERKIMRVLPKWLGKIAMERDGWRKGR